MDRGIFKWTVLGEGTISLVLSALVVFAYWKFQRIQSFGFRLVMLLCLCNCFNSLGYIMVLGDYKKNNWTCQFSGFLLLQSSLCSFAIISLIAYAALQTVVFNAQHFQTKIMKLTGISYVLSGLVAAIPALLNLYTPITQYYCWISPADEWYYPIFGLAVTLGCLWISIIFFLYCLFAVEKHLRRMAHPQAAAQFYKKLLYFPFIMLVCWLPATVNRIFMWFQDPNKDHDNSWMYFMHASSNMLGSVLSAIIYGFNDQVNKEFRRLMFSKQSLEDHTHLDEIDNQRKIREHPTLQYQFGDSSIEQTSDLKNSDIAFFFNNEDDGKSGYKKQNLPRLINYSHYSEDGS